MHRVAIHRQGVAAKCKDQPWTCKRCGFLLGFGMDIEGKTHLRVKVGDEFIYIYEPEQVVRNCKRCGYMNETHRLNPDGSDPGAPSFAPAVPVEGS